MDCFSFTYLPKSHVYGTTYVTTHPNITSILQGLRRPLQQNKCQCVVSSPPQPFMNPNNSLDECKPRWKTPKKTNMEPKNWWVSTCFFFLKRGPFLGSMLVFGGVVIFLQNLQDHWTSTSFCGGCGTSTSTASGRMGTCRFADGTLNHRYFLWGEFSSRWWFRCFFLVFTPKIGEMIQFDLRIFFTWVGEKPPPSLGLQDVHFLDKRFRPPHLGAA